MTLLLSVLVNALILSAFTSLIAISCALAFPVSGFINFGYALLILVSAYSCVAVTRWAELPFSVAALLAVALAAAVALLLDRFLYAPLRRRNVGSQALMLASLGVYIAGQSALSIAFGPESYRVGGTSEGSLVLGSGAVVISYAGAYTVAACALLAAVAIAVLRTAGFGTRLRAIAEDRELALLRGVDVRAVSIRTNLFAAFSMAVAGLAWAIEYEVRPAMAFGPFLFGAITAILAGSLRRPAVLIVVTVLLTCLQQILVWHAGLRWQEPLFYLFVIGVLLLRPQGLDAVSRRTV